MEEETRHRLFRWPRYLDGRDARLCCRPRRRGGSREQDSVDCRRDRQRIGESARLSSDRLRDGTNGADPVPRVEPNGPPRGLRREPAGPPGAQIARHPQDRSQRCPRSGAFGPHRILQASAREVFVGPRRPLAHHRVQEAGRPAGDLENQIRGLAVVFGIRLPRALTAAFIDQAFKASEGVAGLSAAMRGLIAARTAVMTAVAAIDSDMRQMTRASAACSRLMTILGVGQLTALAFVAAIDDPSRIRRSRDVGAYLGLVPRGHQSGEVDYVGSISKCGDRRVRTLLYEAANVMLTRYKGQLKLKDWAFAIARRSTMRKARVALARRLAIIMHAMLAMGRSSSSPKPCKPRDWRPKSSSQEERRPREGAGERRGLCSRGQPLADCDFNRAALHPAYPIKCQTSTQRTQAPESVDTRRASALDPLENTIDVWC